MNINTVMQHIVPLRSQVIRYMCRLSDNDLRMAGTRNMTDLMWAAVKEPIETHVTFDREGLDLAFKYFTCTTLTIRLAGITQINVSNTRLEIGKFCTPAQKWSCNEALATMIQWEAWTLGAAPFSPYRDAI